MNAPEGLPNVRLSGYIERQGLQQDNMIKDAVCEIAKGFLFRITLGAETYKRLNWMLYREPEQKHITICAQVFHKDRISHNIINCLLL